MAVPLAGIGLAGVLALVLLQGEQPGEQAIGKPIQGTSRPTLVSAHRPQAIVPTSSDVLVREVLEEGARHEVREAVRSGSTSSTVARTPTAAPSPEPSAAEERRKRGGEPRTHRHRPSSSVPLPPVTTVVQPTVVPETTTPPPDPTVEPVPTGSAETVTPDPTPSPVPPLPVPTPLPEPSANPVPAPESAPPS